MATDAEALIKLIDSNGRCILEHLLFHDWAAKELLDSPAADRFKDALDSRLADLLNTLADERDKVADLQSRL